MPLPSFIIIGAMKAGTTSLVRYLDLHPRIRASRRKEPDYFSHDPTWRRSRAWYEAGFDATDALQCEASTNYSKFPFSRGVPARMHAVLPDIKLIYILRDPVERFRSHLHDGGMTGTVTADMEFQGSRVGDFARNRAVATSRYHMQLEQFLPYYPLDRIHILTLETLSRDPQATLNGVFDFLEIPRFESADFARPHHVSGDRARTITPFGRSLRRLVRAVIPDAKAPRPVRWILSRRSAPPPVLHPVFADALRDFLRPDVEALRALTGQSFPDWSL